MADINHGKPGASQSTESDPLCGKGRHSLGRFPEVMSQQRPGNGRKEAEAEPDWGKGGLFQAGGAARPSLMAGCRGAPQAPQDGPEPGWHGPGAWREGAFSCPACRKPLSGPYRQQGPAGAPISLGSRGWT